MSIWDKYFSHLLYTQYLAGFPPVRKHFQETFTPRQQFLYYLYLIFATLHNLGHTTVAWKNLNLAETSLEAAIMFSVLLTSIAPLLLHLCLFLWSKDMDLFISLWEEIIKPIEENNTLVQHIQQQLKYPKLLLKVLTLGSLSVPFGFFTPDWVKTVQGDGSLVGVFKDLLIPYEGNATLKFWVLAYYCIVAFFAIYRLLIAYNTMFTVVMMQKSLIRYLKDKLEDVVQDVTSSGISEELKYEKWKDWIQQHQRVLKLNDVVKRLAYAPASVSFGTTIATLCSSGYLVMQMEEGRYIFYTVFFSFFVLNNYTMLGLTCIAVEEVEQEHATLFDNVINDQLLSKRFRAYFWMMKARCMQKIKFMCLSMFVLSNNSFVELSRLSASALMALVQTTQRSA